MVILAAAVNAIMIELSTDDQLTGHYRAVAVSLCLPEGWDIPVWHNNKMTWLDTVVNYISWRLPDRPAGQPPVADDAWARPRLRLRVLRVQNLNRVNYACCSASTELNWSSLD